MHILEIEGGALFQRDHNFDGSSRGREFHEDISLEEVSFRRSLEALTLILVLSLSVLLCI